MMDVKSLIERLERGECSNELDVAVETALFKPDQYHVVVRANTAGTKVIYASRDGREETYWANNWSTMDGAREKIIAALRAALEASDA